MCGNVIAFTIWQRTPYLTEHISLGVVDYIVVGKVHIKSPISIRARALRAAHASSNMNRIARRGGRLLRVASKTERDTNVEQRILNINCFLLN